ncbi:uncharacterized protein PAC_12466 [Phialocephala subalpina]|uniref:Uncharacterized protein n=1 Tax=Phialocephala subalpina TaxID=576137 RepID=A0A1L7XC13_9HELO|nr:uncharacterized protein PAC_12466 [Phialocephala subalpina]
MKCGDFGSARLESKNPRSRAEGAEARTQSAVGWRASENTQGTLILSPRKGACSNISQIGLIMHALIMLENKFPASTNKQLWKAPLSKAQYSGKYTHGSILFSRQWSDPPMERLVFKGVEGACYGMPNVGTRWSTNAFRSLDKSFCWT